MLPSSLCSLSNTPRFIGHPEGIANKNNQSSIFDGTLLNLFLSRQRTRLFFHWCAPLVFVAIPTFWERKLNPKLLLSSN